MKPVKKLVSAGKEFGSWDSIKDDFIGALSKDEFITQYGEFLSGNRELDKFLIRGMVRINIAKIDNNIIQNWINLGTKLIELNNKIVIDITDLDTSNIRDMSNMFYGCSDFDQNINSWDVSNVTSMSNTFAMALYFNQPLGNWDT
jgi:surface protein